MRRGPHLLEGLKKSKPGLSAVAASGGRKISTERHVFLNVLGIAFMHQRRLTKAVFPFAVFALQQVALALTAAKNLTGAGDFEPFGNGFSSFGDACVFGHKGAKASWDTLGCKRKNTYSRGKKIR